MMEGAGPVVKRQRDLIWTVQHHDAAAARSSRIEGTREPAREV